MLCLDFQLRAMSRTAENLASGQRNERKYQFSFAYNMETFSAKTKQHQFSQTNKTAKVRPYLLAGKHHILWNYKDEYNNYCLLIHIDSSWNFKGRQYAKCVPFQHRPKKLRTFMIGTHWVTESAKKFYQPLRLLLLIENYEGISYPATCQNISVL